MNMLKHWALSPGLTRDLQERTLSEGRWDLVHPALAAQEKLADKIISKADLLVAEQLARGGSLPNVQRDQ
jgi:hypothetical protein